MHACIRACVCVWEREREKRKNINVYVHMYGCQCVWWCTSLGVHVGLQWVDRSLKPHTVCDLTTFFSKGELHPRELAIVRATARILIEVMGWRVPFSGKAIVVKSNKTKECWQQQYSQYLFKLRLFVWAAVQWHVRHMHCWCRQSCYRHIFNRSTITMQ